MHTIAIVVFVLALALMSVYQNRATGVGAGRPQVQSTADALEECTQVLFERRATDSLVNAERAIAACAAAIQSRELTPKELAVARFSRGTARMAIGDRILASGDYLEALRHYDSAIDPLQPDALAFYRRGATLEERGQTDPALSTYGEAMRRDSKPTLAYYRRAILLATRERAYVRAIGDFDKVLDLFPDDLAALMRRGDAFSQLGHFGRALADLNRAVALAPDEPRPYVHRGLANGRRGEMTLALADFDAALAIDPANVDALRNRGALYATLGRQDLAIRDFDAAIVLNGIDPILFFNRGYAHFARRQYELALIDYGTAIALDANLGVAYANRCLTRTIMKRDLVAAMADCDRALKLMPYNLDVRETRGFIYLKLGDPAIAAVEYRAVLDVDPNRALALYGLGLAKVRLGQTKDGQADIAAARALSATVDDEFTIYGVD